MLGFIFGFNARLGRLQYFLASLAFGFLLMVLGFGIIGHAYQKALSFNQLAGPALVIAGLFILGTFMLNCMRIRDIGWDPVVVVVGWIAFQIIDSLIAHKVPAWSLGGLATGTVIGAFVNFGTGLILLFWPSGYATDDAPPLPRDADERSDSDWRKAADNRIARVASGQFGGRGQ
ncbi:DUF805 domain-containing protein [Bradyrhizobium jicamae]|uniref:DUF805 domain-containing protein n=1 Tax=Bradyrhizobium jicamae TaxID=280332 RepID=UPI001BA596F9|nr:DUF805 domain-containing protein [Bradyrhizobium jicamae]MBR0752859.1 DUF805 domain-containing protein [Bradyrhizobium jicamae]